MEQAMQTLQETSSKFNQSSRCVLLTASFRHFFERLRHVLSILLDDIFRLFALGDDATGDFLQEARL